MRGAQPSRAADTPITTISNTIEIDLLQMLGDKDSRIRNCAAEALCSIGTSAVPCLIEALQEKKLHTNERAGAVLIRIGKPAIPELVRALGHNAFDVRSWVNYTFPKMSLFGKVDE